MIPPKNKNRGAVGGIIGEYPSCHRSAVLINGTGYRGLRLSASPPAIILSHLRCSFYFKSRNDKPVCQAFTVSLHQPSGSPSGRNRCQRDRPASEGGSVRPCPLHHAAIPLSFSYFLEAYKQKRRRRDWNIAGDEATRRNPRKR